MIKSWSILKNLIVFLIGVFQFGFAIFWFLAFLEDLTDPNFNIYIRPLVHFLFGILGLFGLLNIFLGLVNFLQHKNLVQNPLTVTLLTVVLTVLIFLMLRFAFTIP